MKKVLIIIISFVFSVSSFAQHDVTKFLGFPVDGPKYEMVRNLESKGFKLTTLGDAEFLSGRFNGMDVHVYISTENGKVSRIMVCDENTTDERGIKIRFNKLCQQFNDNGKYLSLSDYTIPDDEDISYQTNINKKRYEAIFYQLPDEDALEKLQASVLQQAQSKYTPTQLENPSDEIKAELFSDVFNSLANAVKNKPVWFMISDLYGKYYITMFYDNELNRAQGEDL